MQKENDETTLNEYFEWLEKQGKHQKNLLETLKKKRTDEGTEAVLGEIFPSYKKRRSSV